VAHSAARGHRRSLRLMHALPRPMIQVDRCASEHVLAARAIPSAPFRHCGFPAKILFGSWLSVPGPKVTLNHLAAALGSLSVMFWDVMVYGNFRPSVRPPDLLCAKKKFRTAGFCVG